MPHFIHNPSKLTANQEQEQAAPHHCLPKAQPKVSQVHHSQAQPKSKHPHATKPQAQSKHKHPCHLHQKQPSEKGREREEHRRRGSPRSVEAPATAWNHQRPHRHRQADKGSKETEETVGTREAPRPHSRHQPCEQTHCPSLPKPTKPGNPFTPCYFCPSQNPPQ